MSATTAAPARPSAIVAIGASAGGLAALKQLFVHVPADSGLAFVIVVHLSPDHESHLESLLQPYIKMPVQQVTRTVPIEPNRVYVIPPNANLDTIDTHLRLSELERRRQERAPIDHFFCTLAAAHDGEAIGIVLTGSGSDGSLGLRRIKERGGLAIVQDPDEAEFSGMPRSAVATTQVDLVLPLAKIPEAFLRFTRTEPKLRLPADTDDTNTEARQFLHKVLVLARGRTGRDFAHHKRSTLLRRIARRMQFNQVEEPSNYARISCHPHRLPRAATTSPRLCGANRLRHAASGADRPARASERAGQPRRQRAALLRSRGALLRAAGWRADQ